MGGGRRRETARRVAETERMRRELRRERGDGEGWVNSVERYLSEGELRDLLFLVLYFVEVFTVVNSSTSSIIFVSWGFFRSVLAISGFDSLFLWATITLLSLSILRVSLLWRAELSGFLL